MTCRYNEFYNRCGYLKWIYPKSTSITASRVVAWCKIFKVNLYKFRTDKDQHLMCCINKSPYQEKNCIYFLDKNRQTTFKAFGGE